MAEKISYAMILVPVQTFCYALMIERQIACNT